ncbi:unnamed protein product [Cylindrotheca closterium]|uniref:Uncharacterized protein n=1 Tax=Cylindrotheca closterium TaxID=2856 RepID=A0AAD2G8W0_9STRA|nr:unnamed protein product [Cylindrotheca closterium]
MLQIDFVDSKGRCFGDEVDEADLTGGVLDLWTLECNDEANEDFSRLSKLLNQSLGKLESIIIRDACQISPQYLALLTSSCIKTNELRLEECTLNDTVCSCLMSSMTHPDGVKKLSIERPVNPQALSAYQAQLIFKGLASSSTLEKLELSFRLANIEDSGKALAQALQQNRSVKMLKLHTPKLHSREVLCDIFKAATMNGTLEVLNLELHKGERRLPSSLLQECLCREHCSVKSLILKNIAVDSDSWENTKQNTSVTTLHLDEANVTCQQAIAIVRSFKSLEHLNLDHNPFLELEPLEDLLLEEGCKLETLVVSMKSQIDKHDEWIRFFQKIGRMQSLKRISFPVFAVADSESKQTLLEALYVNTSLESTYLMDDKHEFEQNVFVLFCYHFSVPLSLNRGGRRALQEQPTDQPLQRNLWPLVLERAMRLKYYSVRDEWQAPILRSRRLDVVFWLLREKLFT